MLRNYRAYSMTEALAAVRRDLGADAVILHTRSFTQGGFLGIGRRTVVEVTAAPAASIDSGRARTRPERAAADSPREAREARADAPVPSPEPPLNLDRERTRLLAQAMSVTLDREASDAPRTGAAASASANEAATRRAAGDPRPTHAVQPAPRAAAEPPAPQVASLPPAHVAKRYVLVAPGRNDAAVAGSLRHAAPVRASAPEPRRESIVPQPSRPARQEPVDLDAIDRLVRDVLERGQAEPPPGRLSELYATLIAHEVGKELAQRVVDDIRATLTADELASEHAVRSAAVQRVARLLPPCRALAPAADGSWRRDGRPLTVAFVGPTGVGKTTTVAKVAASLRLRHGARVGLVTTDTYRIGAVDQLRTYADIISSPLEIVMNVADMREALERLGDRDVILIDTAGRSQNDGSRLSELGALLAEAAPHETHLVLSSVASERALTREAQAFARVGVDRVVLTKLDEAAGLGAALRILRDVGHALSYVTMGQEVPQHIEAASAGRIAALLVSADASQAPSASPARRPNDEAPSSAVTAGSATR